jgi:hypothetical protein
MNEQHLCHSKQVEVQETRRLNDFRRTKNLMTIPANLTKNRQSEATRAEYLSLEIHVSSFAQQFENTVHAIFAHSFQ